MTPPTREDREVAIQREYYKTTAREYDSSHLLGEAEHDFALMVLESIIRHHDIRSVLDIGAGTGRVAVYLKSRFPELRVASIEPVEALREIGHAKGLSTEELRDGDAKNLDFADGAFDLVSEFGVLHHIPGPSAAVREMLRVARVGIFISDTNNFGTGGALSRLMKQAINAVGLWRLADLIKTRGTGYTISEGDGLAYSYSVFNDFDLIKSQCKSVHHMNTLDGGINPYRTASHTALFGVKKTA